jgi:hypothetical protein
MLQCAEPEDSQHLTLVISPQGKPRDCNPILSTQVTRDPSVGNMTQGSRKRMIFVCVVRAGRHRWLE